MSLLDYQLKYIWSGFDKNDQEVLLEIYQKGTAALSPVQIEGLVGLQFNLQGDQGRITAPIAKTSLEITLVDAPDLSTPGVKRGDWMEFFTPDATKYWVRLYTFWRNLAEDEDGPVLFWQGYITPDSLQEGLDYHGTVRITARDNLGHLQDFEFDALGDKNGLISVRDLVTQALEKVEVDCMFFINSPSTGDASYLKDNDGHSLLDSLIVATQFVGQTWYDALKAILESLGLCLRFYGGSAITLQPIRNLPLRSGISISSARENSAELQFYGGTRSKDPAFKKIQEVMDFQSSPQVSLDLRRNLSIGTSATIYTSGKRYDQRSHTWVTYTGRCFNNDSLQGETQGGWLYGLGFLDGARCQLNPRQNREEGSAALRSGVYLVADYGSDTGGPSPTYRMACSSTDITVRCEFGRPVVLQSTSAPYTIARTWSFIKKAVISIKYTDPNGTELYWDGSGWVSTQSLFSIDVAEDLAESYNIEIALRDVGSLASLGGWLDISFKDFTTEESGRNNSSGTTFYGSFVWLLSIVVEMNAGKILKRDTIRTINNESYNVLLERKPAVGALSVKLPFFSPENYPGGLWKYQAGLVVPYGYANYWQGFGSNTAIPLPAQIHKQLLCFNHEALDVLEGYCGLVEGSTYFRIDYDFTYKGKHYLLQSCTADILKQKFTRALFHEYIWYSDLWNENNNPDYNGAPVYDK